VVDGSSELNTPYWSDVLLQAARNPQSVPQERGWPHRIKDIRADYKSVAGDFSK
jgi:hypothetical protein